MWTKPYRIVRGIGSASQRWRFRLMFFQKLTEAVKVNPPDVPLKPGS
jgi:hypothetical protein